jgi:catechol 2,3-dioxygenase-like lactoylglutathione lyase family enzyme
MRPLARCWPTTPFTSLGRATSSRGLATKATTRPPLVRELHIIDQRQHWERIGFTMHESGVFNVGAVRLHIQPEGIQPEDRRPGISGIGFLNLHGKNFTTCTDGLHFWSLPNDNEHVRPPHGDSQHGNGAYKIDHVVLRTTNVERTNDWLVDQVGLTLRKRTTDIYPGATQLFYREDHFSKDVPIVEVVGPTCVDNSPEETQAYVWGVTFVVPSLMQVRNIIGVDHTSAIKPAKQKGRDICILKKSGNVSTNVAFMTPHRHV